MNSLTLEDKEGVIVAKLYINPDGTLHEDSWLRFFQNNSGTKITVKEMQA